MRKLNPIRQVINKLDEIIDKYCEVNVRFNYLIELMEGNKS